MNDILTRSVSGIVVVAIIIGSIFAGGVWFYMAMGIIAVLTLDELHRNFAMKTNEGGSKALHISKIAIGLVCYMVVATPFYYYELRVNDYEWAMTSFLLLILFMLFMFVIELFWGKGDMIRAVGLDVLGIIYIILPFAMLSYIANSSVQIWSFDRYLLLAFFCIIWGNDTFAYLTGITLGRHRMFERVSPKKSWEGFVGGILFSLIIGWVFSLFIDFGGEYNWIWFALVISISSVLGDFFESSLKRSVGIKDSGKLIPGHGGLLDRFDAMLFASPMTALLLFIVNNIINND